MTLTVNNAKELADILKQWINEDRIYQLIEDKGHVLVIENAINRYQIQIDLVQDPLHILISIGLELLEEQQQLIELMNESSFLSHRNLYSTIAHFDVCPEYQINDQNNLSTIIMRRQIYLDDLTRNLFFKFINEMYRAQKAVDELIRMMKLKE